MVGPFPASGLAGVLRSCVGEAFTGFALLLDLRIGATGTPTAQNGAPPNSPLTSTHPPTPLSSRTRANSRNQRGLECKGVRK